MAKLKLLIFTALFSIIALTNPVNAQILENTQISTSPELNYLQAVINKENAVETNKSTLFDAGNSFIPNPDQEQSYFWDFGDGNSDEGIEVLHMYKEPGDYTITLTIKDGENESIATKNIYSYRKIILLLSDNIAIKERLEVIKQYAKQEGVYIQVIESFGSSTEFISEEILAKKLIKDSSSIENSKEILIWTEQNAGLNALSRFIQSKEKEINFEQKSIIIIDNDFSNGTNRLQNQYNLISPKNILVAKEVAIYPLIESSDNQELIEKLNNGGYEYKVVDEKFGKLRPWNFMSYIVNILIEKGIPDNTIALLLLLPIIAFIITIMKQFVGLTTFGIYTPAIMTLSFLIIGVHAGLLTLLAAFTAAAIAKIALKGTRMLFIPKMSIVITLVALSLLFILTLSLYLDLFNAEFLSIAIFPMIILSTLVEKLIKVKDEKKLMSTLVLMGETTVVALVAFIIAGGKINIGSSGFQIKIVRETILNYPELIFLLLILNFAIGKWSGLRLVERYRFREILRHIEE